MDKHKISVSYTWVKLLLQEAGLVAREKKRGQYRRRRERRALPGMLLPLDGSMHHWFDHRQDDMQTLLSVIDDATSISNIKAGCGQGCRVLSEPVGIDPLLALTEENL